MANQWGRENGAPSSGARSRAPVFIVAIIALAMGLAGGYGVFRLSGAGDDAAMTAARDAADRLKAENARLTDQLTAAQAALDDAKAAGSGAAVDGAALRDQIAGREQEIEALTQQVEAARADDDAAAATMEKQAAQIEALTKERDALRQGAATGDSALAAERDRLARQVDELNAEIDTLTAGKVAAEDNVAALQGQLDAVKADLASAKAALADMAARAAQTETPPDTQTGTDGATPPPTGDAAAPAQRDVQAVEAALADAPGLDALSAEDRQALRDALVSGECVTTALEAVFDHVPILALRNLIRDLNSGC